MMIWTLLAYISFWVALFCLALAGLLYLSARTRSESLKGLLRRFGQDPAETVHVREILRRFGILFLAAGIFFVLISTPTDQMSPEDQGVLTLVQVVFVVIVIWQIKGLRNLTKSQPGPGARSTR